MASYTEWDRLVNLFRASSKSPNIAKAFDEAKRHSIRQDSELTALAALINVPIPPIPPPPGGALGAALPARMPESTGTVHYVRTDGNNANNGLTNSAGGAWQTIQKACDTLTAGQIAKVVAGTYAAASSELSVIRDLGGPQPATIEAFDPANKPILLGSMRPQNSGSAAARYWRFRNIKLDGTNNGDEYGVKITGNGTSTVPHHLEFYGFEIYNVYSGAANIPQGVSIQGGTGTSVPNSLHFYNCLIRNIGGANSTPRNQTHSFYAGSVEGLVVANGVHRDQISWGIRLGSATSSVQGVRNSYFVNNTIVRSEASSGGGGITLFSDGTSVPSNHLDRGNFFYNNIVSDVQGNYAYSSWFQNSGPADVFSLWDKNIAYLYGNLFRNAGFVSSTFVANPVNADPLFVDKAGNNFHLQGGSPAINAGLADYTPTFDYDGNARVTADLGAFRA